MVRRRTRLKLLGTLARDPHRYVVFRAATQAFSIAFLWAVPVSGLARVDLWRGGHLLGFRPAPFNVALAVVIAVFAVVYGATFLINLVAGRMLCGWGCPVGQLHRLTENPRTPGQSRSRRIAQRLGATLWAALLPTSVLAWWVDWRILFEGPPAARLTIAGVLVGATALALAHGRWWSWGLALWVYPLAWAIALVLSWRPVFRPDAHSDVAGLGNRT